MSETAAMPSSRSSRTHSFSSERSPSLCSSVTFQMPTTVRPAPAYIAASVASQTVTDHQNAQLRDEDADGEELQNAIFSEQALALLNGFLDHLLFAFLSSAKAPSLAAIRPAILDVLKPRLAREAIEYADEELQGLLAAEDDDESPTHNTKANGAWDVEKVWKRTRLRIMVYTRLGELEDEDEERYVQQERGLSMDEDEDDEAGLVSWAAAIFLTSVMEFIAEQLLLVSGSAAFARMESRIQKLSQQMEQHEEQSIIERLTIEEPDVEKIALNSALGRIWRTWKKRVRSPIMPLTPIRRMRSTSSYMSLPMRKSSRDTINTVHSGHELLPEHQPTETDIAANIPLPMGNNDINEIEVPGLAPTYEDEDENTDATPYSQTRRPSSAMISSSAIPAKKIKKARPVSLPLSQLPAFVVPTGPIDEDEQSIHTSIESEPADDEIHNDSSKQQHSVPSPRDESHEHEHDASMVAFAAATGLGFRMSTPEPADVQGKNPDGLGVINDISPKSVGKVMSSKRMSIERPGPPGLVRTFSARSSTRTSSIKSPIHTPALTPKAITHAEGKSYLDDDLSEEEPEKPQAIGVARTTNNAIRSTPTTPDEMAREPSRPPARGAYVEVQPRTSTPTSLQSRNNSSPDDKYAGGERLVIRKDIGRKPHSNGDVTSSPIQHESPTSAPRRQDGLRSPSLASSLPALHEVESNPTQPLEKAGSLRNRKSSSPTYEESKRDSTSTNQDQPIQVPDRRLQRISTGESIRSQSAPSEKSPSDNMSLKRGASTSSSLKKQVVYPVTSSGRDSVSSYRSRGLSGRMSEEDRTREFDSLIKGQETVKFTLTPQNMRDLDEPPPHQPVQHRSSSSSSAKPYPRAHPDEKSYGTANLPNTTAPRAKSSNGSHHRPSPSRNVVTRPLARDPKIESESMRDFADFIRSTGPSPGQEKPVQPFVSMNGQNPSSKASNISSSSLGRKLSTRRSSSVNGNSAKARANMEPRSPAGLSTGNGDLIDFIRQGPPDANNGQPRIPRSVAPFRSTVDSDQFDSMLEGHGNVESAYGSATSTLESKNSAQTINSRTGLIASPGVVQPAYSNTPKQLSGSMSASNDEPQVTRTRRRIKDPYAIDLSDEDEDDDEDEDQLTALPPSGTQTPRQAPAQPPRQAAPRQESLMDFLNAMEPPSVSKPQPFMLSEETIAAARARANSAKSQPYNGHGSAHPGSLTSTSITSDAARSYKPRLQARAPASGDARGGGARTGTSDLADFLMNSGPPEPPVIRAPPVKEEKKSRKFWRSKKTYGDLP
ncbi:hypothetical protein COCMIDRAFT_1201 [Bipolaris oryzae ATCC 44560]|uniref:Uncharacterized protein n=1 Tax=Bipolaris oryzae ATCC 44560 TaxID=930090 RepID=W6ZR66_COCMI|nr:uncharacterized protein COCMIDRAFT_1201 [Bipolaris oryzae ATCC 44560]EUC50004.1 hypothetical protein COCMIDRAFT_1201 [Bipolaris oryzae ATCC 44560]